MEVKMISGFLVGEKLEAVKDVVVFSVDGKIEVKIAEGEWCRVVSTGLDKYEVVFDDGDFLMRLDIDKDIVEREFKATNSFRVGDLIEAIREFVFKEDSVTEVTIESGDRFEIVNMYRDKYLLKNNDDEFCSLRIEIADQLFKRVKNDRGSQRDEKTILSEGTETKTDETNDGQWTFSEDEKAILRNLSEEYEWIARDENNNLFVYEVKPTKNHALGVWQVYSSFCKSLKYYNYLFKTIKWTDDEPCEFRKYI